MSDPRCAKCGIKLKPRDSKTAPYCKDCMDHCKSNRFGMHRCRICG